MVRVWRGLVSTTCSDYVSELHRLIEVEAVSWSYHSVITQGGNVQYYIRSVWDFLLLLFQLCAWNRWFLTCLVSLDCIFGKILLLYDNASLQVISAWFLFVFNLIEREVPVVWMSGRCFWKGTSSAVMSYFCTGLFFLYLVWLFWSLISIAVRLSTLHFICCVTAHWSHRSVSFWTSLAAMYVFITHSDLVHHQQFELVTVGISASVIN